jgi:hypothetical protein
MARPATFASVLGRPDLQPQINAWTFLTIGSNAMKEMVNTMGPIETMDQDDAARYIERNADEVAENVADLSALNVVAEMHGYHLVMRMPDPSEGLSNVMALIPKSAPVQFTDMDSVAEFLVSLDERKVQ